MQSFTEAAIDDGRSLLIVSAVFLIGCGVFAVFQASTGHFLPHDTVYLGMSADQLCALDGCRILHFMIHDRISFGGALIAVGLMYAWLTGALWQGHAWAWRLLALSGAIGFKFAGNAMRGGWKN